MLDAVQALFTSPYDPRYLALVTVQHNLIFPGHLADLVYRVLLTVVLGSLLPLGPGLEITVVAGCQTHSHDEANGNYRDLSLQHFPLPLETPLGGDSHRLSDVYWFLTRHPITPGTKDADTNHSHNKKGDSHVIPFGLITDQTKPSEPGDDAHAVPYGQPGVRSPCPP